MENIFWSYLKIMWCALAVMTPSSQTAYWDCCTLGIFQGSVLGIQATVALASLEEDIGREL